jgi:hypothetical protein
MGNGVVEILSGSEELRPFMGVIGTEDSQVSFNFLIGPLCLAISLRMICCGETNIVVKDTSKFSSKCPCSPNRLNTNSKKSWAIPFALMVLVQGTRITPFVRPWSTTTIKESYPLERGRLMTRSTESCLNGRVAVDLIGLTGGVTG